MSGPVDRQALLAHLRVELTRTIADGILFQQAMADRLRLSLGDLKFLTALIESGPMTAGDVAARTGLTSGAVTRMIDRLERGGWVRREHDRRDRRRVIVRSVPERQAEIRPLFEGMSAAWVQAFAGYDDDQIALALDLFGRMREVAREQAALLCEAPDRSEAPGRGGSARPDGSASTPSAH
jgi:DNA-binding MarR family transcriptional regulator